MKILNLIVIGLLAFGILGGCESAEQSSETKAGDYAAEPGQPRPGAPGSPGAAAKEGE